MTLARRDFLSALGGGLAAATWPITGHTGKSTESALDDPAFNLKAFVKLIGALDEAPVYDLIRGSVYALVPGRPAQPLFRTLGAGVASYSQTSALEYRSESRYVGMLLDWNSDALLKKWDNPLNGASCDVPVTRYGPGGSSIQPGRIVPDGFPIDESSAGIWPWFRLGDSVHMTRAVLQESVAHPLFPKADLMTYNGDWRLMMDDAVLRMPSRLNFSAVESWRPWMQMGEDDPTGTLWWHVSGAKLTSADAYPLGVKTLLTNLAPDFFSN